ncbi:hypothetical protein [Metapseudomonas otitidis]|jgi:hypothetical protein|uniref:Uncharacterized protein n=1 Tax=Metapseudomonas otitidis TaxID=319939 RepID=A0ABU3XZ57_9GAMM|nr:hypothetical protein [Pseudomonas otitidis]MDV3443193.1 hypothetical protein [Pseudomonas otitidis]WMR32212.1 hypothetical protein QT513_24045 [Pseudomonas otitidis]
MDTIFAFLLGLFGAGDNAAEAQATPSLPAPISEQQWQADYNRALTLPAIRYSSSDQVTIIKNERDGTVYLFTTQRHPAHPAVIERRLVDGLRYRSSGRYAGDGEAYAAWLEKYRRFDDRPYTSMSLNTELSAVE